MSKIGKLLIDATTSNIIVTRKVPFKGTLGEDKIYSEENIEFQKFEGTWIIFQQKEKSKNSGYLI